MDDETFAVSVVVPTHGGRASVLATVQALLRSERAVVEVLVVSDGDASEARRILRHVSDPRLILLEKEKQGANAARNYGLRHARFDWVAFVDDDDVPRDNWLQVWGDLVTPRTGVATAALNRLEEGKSPVQKACKLSMDDPTMRASQLMAGGFLVRRELLVAVDGYDTAVPAAQNQDLGLRLIDAVRGSGLEVASSDDVVLDVYVEGGESRLVRYGARHADACRLFMERYADRLAVDRPTRAAYHRIIARTERQNGNYRLARFHALEACKTNPRSWSSYKNLMLALVPVLERLRK